MAHRRDEADESRGTIQYRRRRRGGGRWEVGEWREKRSASAIDVDVDGTKSQIKVGRSCDPG